MCNKDKLRAQCERLDHIAIAFRISLVEGSIVGKFTAAAELLASLGLKPGDRVYYAGDITRPGSNSEYQLVDERIVGRTPVSLSDAEAAALPLTAITAWEGLFDRLRISRNKDAEKTLLIIRDFINYYESDLIQECDCGRED